MKNKNTPSKKQTHTHIQAKDLVLIPLFSVIIIICSYICIPLTIPFTMQTFAVFFTLLMLGGKKGTISIFLYLLLGFIGLPVFSQGRGGIGILFGTTGGFLVGFLLIGFLYQFNHFILRKIFFLTSNQNSKSPAASSTVFNKRDEAVQDVTLTKTVNTNERFQSARYQKAEQIVNIVSLVLGLMFSYLFGSLWFYFLYTKTSSLSLTEVLGMCVIPFLLPDLIKLITALIMSSRLKRHLY